MSSYRYSYVLSCGCVLDGGIQRGLHFSDSLPKHESGRVRAMECTHGRRRVVSVNAELIEAGEA